MASEAEECSSALTTSRNGDDIEDTKCPKQTVSVSWSNAEILALLDIWTACLVSFHIGVFCFDARQFGAFHFGDFHFDAVPVRRVSLWRASSSARFSLARFHFGAFLFGAFPNFVRTYDDPVSANASFRADFN